MTSQQEAHLARIKYEFVELVGDKYRAGQAEHGGNLWEKSVQSLLDNAILEAVDQFVYLLSLRERLTAVKGANIDPDVPFELK